jgi:hypothetical protein
MLLVLNVRMKFDYVLFLAIVSIIELIERNIINIKAVKYLLFLSVFFRRISCAARFMHPCIKVVSMIRKDKDRYYTKTEERV